MLTTGSQLEGTSLRCRTGTAFAMTRPQARKPDGAIVCSTGWSSTETRRFSLPDAEVAA